MKVRKNSEFQHLIILYNIVSTFYPHAKKYKLLSSQKYAKKTYISEHMPEALNMNNINIYLIIYTFNNEFLRYRFKYFHGHWSHHSDIPHSVLTVIRHQEIYEGKAMHQVGDFYYLSQAIILVIGCYVNRTLGCPRPPYHQIASVPPLKPNFT